MSINEEINNKEEHAVFCSRNAVRAIAKVKYIKKVVVEICQEQ